LLLANRGVRSTEVMPQNLTYSVSFSKVISSVSIEIAVPFSFFLTPSIFEDAVSVLGLNSLGSRFLDSRSVLLAYLKRSGRNFLHFGQSWSLG